MPELKYPSACALRSMPATSTTHAAAPGVETRFAHALKHARQVRTCHAQRQQVDAAGDRAANQPCKEGDFASAAIGERAGDQAAEQRHEREDADDAVRRPGRTRRDRSECAGASKGSTVPIPRNPRNVAPTKAQNCALKPRAEKDMYLSRVTQRKSCRQTTASGVE